MRAVAVAIVAAAVVGAVVAPAGANRQAQERVDRRVSCKTATGALNISAFARNPAVGAAAADIGTGDPSRPIVLVGVDTRYKHYTLGSSCRRVTRRVALTHRGLTSAGVVRAGDYRSPIVYCAATAHVLLHFQISFDAAGKPASATMAVRSQPKLHNGITPRSKPIGYVQWSPQRSVTYYSSRACTTN